MYSEEIWYRNQDVSRFFILLGDIDLSTEAMQNIFEKWLSLKDTVKLSSSFFAALKQTEDLTEQEKENIDIAIKGWRMVRGTAFTKNQILEYLQPEEEYSNNGWKNYEEYIFYKAAYDYLCTQKDNNLPTKLLTSLLAINNNSVHFCRKTGYYIIENPNESEHWILCESTIFP